MCGKEPYATKKAAKKKIKLLNKLGLCAKKLTNAYYCEECSNYHVTSASKIGSRNYTRHLNKLSTS